MKYGKKYAINKTSKVIIYGAATTGAIVYSTFIRYGIEVIAFIDKRADEIESYYNLPVIDLNQTEKLIQENRDIIIVIGIKNVFEHEKIAKKICGLGCNKIIFRPYKEIKGEGSEKDKEINTIYSSILSGELPQEVYEVADFEEQSFSDKAIIETDDNYVVANIPIYYVFTDRYKDRNILWGDIPCLGLVPHIGLFNFFSGTENEDYHEYIKFCREAALRSGGIKISKAWEESVYKNRLDVFNHMQYEWEHDKGFFIKNAVEAAYNEGGYFNIKSGKHRVVFLLVMGKRYIPLKIRKYDYAKWCNTKKTEEIRSLLKSLNKESLPAVIGNPYFYDYPCSTSSFYEQVLMRLISVIYQTQYYERKKFDFSKENILLYNTPMALYADVLHMIGFEVDILEDDAKNKAIYKAVSGQGVKEKLEENKEYFLVVVDGKKKLDDKDVNIKNKVYITSSKDENGRLLASGLGEKEFLYAFLTRRG